MKKIYLVPFFIWLLSSPVCHAADVSGKVVFSGTPPSNAALDTGSDPYCGKSHPEGLSSEEAVVSVSGGLKNVFIYLKSGVTGSFEVPEQPVVLDQDGCRFEPHVFGLRVGQPLEMRNSDDTLHNVRSHCSKNKRFNVGMPTSEMRVTKKFNQPEIMVRFHCDVHPWMSAYAGVLDHPFYAVSGEDGSFVIRGLPPGSYEIEARHEKFGVRQTRVTVTEEDTQIHTDFEFSS